MSGILRHALTTALVLTALLIGNADSARSSEKPMRVVTVKIVADRNFASQEVWKRKAARQIDDIAGEIRDLLGVNLKVIGYAEWRGNGADSLYHVAVNMVDDIPAGDADILIGFTYGPCPNGAKTVYTDGVTIPFRGLVVRNYYAPCDRNTFTPYALIHEMVHLFGGVHVGQGTLMSPVYTGDIYLRLDPINRAIIGLTRDIDFRSGYASLGRPSLEKLTELYKKAIAMSGGDMTVLTDLADVYRALGHYDTALDIYRGILHIDSAATPAWLNMAECYFAENRRAKFYFKLGEYDRAHRYAAQAAWHGIAVDSGFIKKIKEHYVPGDTSPKDRK
jgi:tetratricopeptide (TPR) repeat protein